MLNVTTVGVPGKHVPPLLTMDELEVTMQPLDTPAIDAHEGTGAHA